MDLILWRHAEAAPGAPDHERALTDKGHAQAKRMAQWLKLHLPEDAVILVSPALRAQQTAMALKRPFETVDALDTTAERIGVLKAVGPPKAGRTIVAVGHQPTLGRVASWLLTGIEGDLAVKKAAVWWISVRGGKKGLAVLRAVMTPQLL